MEDNDNVAVKVSLDTSKIESKLKDISSSIGGLKTTMLVLKDTVTGEFSSTRNSLKAIENGLLGEGQALQRIVGTIMNAVSTGSNNIVQEVQKI